MDKNYWEEYYKNQSPGNYPSDFAKYCSNIYKLNDHGTIYDIGCGNGRDTIFFSSKSIPAIGVEQSENAIEQNKLKIINQKTNLKFIVGNFTNFDYSLYSKSFSIYSRFTLHAINYEEEKLFFKHIFKLKKLKNLFIEVRTINDDLYGKGTKIGKHEYITSHYRRFIDPKILKSQIQDFFHIDYFEESRGFSKTDNDDPVLLRLVCRRK